MIFLRSRTVLFHQSRWINITAVKLKQPPHDRERLKRHQPAPRHRLPFVDEAPLEYLPEKPISFPVPTENKRKMLRFKHGESLKRLPTAFDKLQELYYLENNLWYHTLDVPLKRMGSIEFVQQLTRTNLLPLSLESSECPALQSHLASLLDEELFSLNRRPINLHDQRPEAVQRRSQRQASFISSILSSSYTTWLRTHPEHPLMREPHQMDEGATVEAFFKRNYSKEFFEIPEDVAEDVYDSVDDTVFDSIDETVRYRIRCRLAWQLRGSLPLQPFTDWDDPLCVEDRLPPCQYRPESFDLKPVDCLRFSMLPHTQTLDFSEHARSVAGYWSHTPFWPGDPCEFCYVGALNLSDDHRVLRDIEELNQPAEVKQQLRTTHGLCEAILAAFAWTTAQAYNMGFTLYTELTYPFAGQLLLFDNDHVQLLRYQLNSLTASLTASEDAHGSRFNLAWYSPRLPLYQLDSAQSVSVNPEAISLLTHAFAHPIDQHRSQASLHPYLSHPKPREEPRRLIPDNTSAATDDAVVADAESLLAKLEKAAWESRRDQSAKHPLRLRTPRRPHPNDVYYLKTTKRSDLIAEFMEEMPSFGGQFAKLPEPYASLLKEYERAQREKLPRDRVQAPPRRWR